MKSLEDLARLREEVRERMKVREGAKAVRITVGMGTCGIAAGARDAMKAILETIEADNVSGVVVTQTGCIGLCEWEPIVQVTVGGQEKVTYGKVSPERARRIVKEHVENGKVVAEFVIPA